MKKPAHAILGSSRVETSFMELSLPNNTASPNKLNITRGLVVARGFYGVA